jgi:apolipoprotein N-acyltransferase
MRWAKRHLVVRAGLLGLLAGVLVALSLPPFGLWPAALVGIGMLALTLRGCSRRQRLVAGLFAGLGQFGIGLAFTASFSLAGAVVLVVAESAFVAVACLATPSGPGGLGALVGLLTLAEAVRERWPFGGLPLAGVALGQAGGPLLLPARLGGPLAVAGATYLAGASTAALFWKGTRRGGLAGLAGVASLVLAGWLAPAGGPVRSRVPVALVQGGGPRGLSSLQVPAWVPYEATLKAAEAIRPGSARLVVLPEDVVRLAGPLVGSPEDRRLAALARHLRATVLAGVTRLVGATRFDNEVVAWAPSGHIVARFEKVHPVPFGEYVPFRSFFAHFANLSEVPRDAIVGHGTGAISTPAGRLALLVSFEDFFSARGRSGVRAGGRLLVLATNTASYATSQVPTQELAASRLQAVAEGRDLVQAATTGFSGLVNASGSVQARSTLGARSVVEVMASLRSGQTLYDRLGSAPVLLAATILALFGLWRASRERRRTLRASVPQPGLASHEPVGARRLVPASRAKAGSFLNSSPLKRRNLPTHMTA